MIGCWYLVTDEYDALENSNSNYTHSEPLKAETEEDAIAEARQIWAGRTPYVGWGFVRPSAYERMMYPINPRIVYTVPLDV